MAKAKAKLKVKAKSKAAAKAKPALKTKAKSAVKAKIKAKIKTKTKAKPVAKAKAKPKTQAKSKPTVMAKVKPATTLDLTNFLSPLDNRLIIQITVQEARTAGGLYIPETAMVTGNKQGVVIAVGRGHRDSKGRLRPMDVRRGDEVLFAEYSGDEIEIMGQKLKILRETDVMGVVTGR